MIGAINTSRDASASDGYKSTEFGFFPSNWHISTIDDLVKDNVIAKPMDGNHGNIHPKSSDFVDDGIPFVMANNVQHGIVDLCNCSYISKKQADTLQKGFSKEGDILLTHKATIGNTAIVGEISTDYIMLTPQVTYYRVTNFERLDNRYLRYCMDGDMFQTQLISSSGGGTRAYIGITEQRKLSVVIPPLKEQTAIANALSDMDALLTELEQLIAKKQAIKTATMQQLLTGKTRLPQFATYTDCEHKGQPKGMKPSELGEIPEDWEVEPLGALLSENPKYGINAAAVPLSGNLPVYIRITDISEDGYFKPTKKVGVNSPFSDMYKLKLGDIVLARTGASVGKSYLYQENDGELVFAGFLIKISPDQKRLSSEFLSHFLKTNQYWNWVTVNSMRSGQPGINSNQYKSLQLALPKIHEQNAIANILSDMDAEIQALEQRLAKTRQIKQGMMQELLTGKTRLPVEADD